MCGFFTSVVFVLIIAIYSASEQSSFPILHQCPSESNGFIGNLDVFVMVFTNPEIKQLNTLVAFVFNR